MCLALAREVVEKILIKRGETIRRIGARRLLRRGFQEADLDDFVQETYLRVLQKIRSVRTPKQVHAFTDTTARNLAIDWLRKRRETIEVDEAMPELMDETTPIDILIKEEEKREQRELTLAAAEFLKPNLRETVLGRFNGESYAEIAERLNVKKKTVRSYRHRSVLRMQKLIKEHGAALIPMAREERKKRLKRERGSGKKASR